MRISHLAISVFLYQAHVGSVQAQSAFQSGPKSADTYAGGMVLDSSTNRIFVTGATYEVPGSSEPSSVSSCFLGMLKVPDFEWKDQKYYGNPNITEACNAVHFYNENEMLVIGTSEEDGLFTNLNASNFSATQYGFVMSVNHDSHLVVGHQLGAALLNVNPVQVPVAVAVHKQHVFVASITSNDSNVTATETEQFPDWTLGGALKFGSSYGMMIHRYSTSSSTTTFTLDWLQKFNARTRDDGKTPSVYVEGMMAKGDVLLVVGSTRGSGEAFGDNEGTDEDGFVSKIDIETGDLYVGTDSLRNVGRIGQEDDDIVTNLCDDPNDPNAFYVVGASRADTDLIPLVSKMRLDSLSPTWTQFFRPIHPEGSHAIAYGLGCQVSGDVLYVVGTIEDGANMMATGVESYGSDDIFAAQVKVSDGSVNWIKQVGSSGKETLAHGGGLAVDSTGNAILYGSTTGALFREKDGESFSDLFAFTLNKADGAHTTPLSMTPTNPSFTQQLASLSAGDEDEVSTGSVSIRSPSIGKQLEDPLYAGGLQYHPESNSIYFTGATFKSSSSCFVGTLSLDDMETTVTQLGNTDVPEACSAVSIGPAGATSAYIIGGSGQGGAMAKFYNESMSTVTQFGTVLQVSLDGLFKNMLTGGFLLQGIAVTYPVALLVDESNEYVYVVSLSSKDASETSDATLIDLDPFPDLTSGGYRRYGFRYELRLTKLNIMEPLHTDTALLRETLTVAFDHHYATDDESSVYTTALAIVGDQVVVVGNTRGSGGIFGEGAGSDMDGFVVKMNPLTGVLSAEGSVSSRRVMSSNQKDDWVTHICTDPNDGNEFYIVGATKGYYEDIEQQPLTGSINPFIVKMNVDSLEPVWWQQLKASPATDSAGLADASAYGCSVDGSSNAVYVAGVVKDGAVMVPPSGPLTSAGNNDLFVARLEGTDGEVTWIKQVGTSKNEFMARGGGISMDSFGNVILLGETEGSLYRTRTDGRKLEEAAPLEIILFSVSQDGTIETPVVEPTSPVEPESSPTTPAETEPAPEEPVPAEPAPVPAAGGDETKPTKAPTSPTKPADPSPTKEPTAPAPNPAPSPKAQPASDRSSLKDKQGLWIALYAIGGLLLIALFCLFWRRVQKKGKEKANQRKTLAIFKYLRAFDVDDIDIRRSPAGGYHGTYLNTLAFGKNKADSTVASGTQGHASQLPTINPGGMTHSSVADDYLFMSKRIMQSSDKTDTDDDSATGLSRRV